MIIISHPLLPIFYYPSFMKYLTYTIILFACIIVLTVFTNCSHDYEIKNENPVSPTQVDLKSAVVNVYIENSGSMDGYMHPSSEFKNDLYSYISGISSKVKITNLNYISSAIVRINQDPETFFANLNPTSFKMSGLNTKHSEIVNMFKEILAKTGPDTISIFASDCILDVTGGDAKDFFESRRTTLRDIIANKLGKDKDFSVEIFSCESSFDGYLYPYQSSPVAYKGKRPYYVWIFGPKNLIGALNEKVSPFESFRTGGIKNSASFADCGQMPYTLNLLSQEGNTLTIRGKMLEFDVLANLSSALLNDNVISKVESYSYTDSKASVVETGRIEDKQSPYTHYMHIKFNNTSKPIKQSIALPMNIEPKWAENLNDDSVGIEKNKTYGIKYLIYAVSDAYKSATPAQIQFVINKK